MTKKKAATRSHRPRGRAKLLLIAPATAHIIAELRTACCHPLAAIALATARFCSRAMRKMWQHPDSGDWRNCKRAR